MSSDVEYNEQVNVDKEDHQSEVPSIHLLDIVDYYLMTNHEISAIESIENAPVDWSVWGTCGRDFRLIIRT